jgi:hypothetical protein
MEGRRHCFERNSQETSHITKNSAKTSATRQSTNATQTTATIKRTWVRQKAQSLCKEAVEVQQSVSIVQVTGARLARVRFYSFAIYRAARLGQSWLFCFQETQKCLQIP